MWTCWLWLWMACAPSLTEVQLQGEQGGLTVSSAASVGHVSVFDEGGRPLAQLTAPPGAKQLYVPLPAASGSRVRVRVDGVDQWWSVPIVGPVDVAVEAPMGQGRAAPPNGGELRITRVGQGDVDVAMVFTARAPTQLQVRWNDDVHDVRLTAAGDRQVLVLALSDQPVHVEVRGPGTQIAFDLRPEQRSIEDARADLQLVRVDLPTDALGERDLARPEHRVVLPAGWWRSILRASGLGYRPRDDQAPWSWRTVVLSNHGPTDQNLMVRISVVDASGQLASAFRTRMRGVGEDEVRALVRVPRGQQVSVALPLFVDGSGVPNTARYHQRVAVYSLGLDEPLHLVELPLDVQRGSPWASAGMVVALAASALGWVLLLLRTRTWTREIRTTDLVAIALFGSVSFVLGTALQVVGLGFSALLGPFSPLVIGLVDDTLRACLLGTLVILVPQRGVLALATAVGFLMRGLTLGSFHPVDVLYLGSAVFWLEAWAAMAGLTGKRSWRDQSGPRQWARLSLGLGGANLCAMATGLVISVVFYRLYFAGWYVMLILSLPGFVYVSIGAALAVGFARGLRRVEL